MKEKDLDSRKWIPKQKMKNSQGDAMQKTQRIDNSDWNKREEEEDSTKDCYKKKNKTKLISRLTDNLIGFMMWEMTYRHLTELQNVKR